ncbi:class I SAM-dependent methyltransferase [Mangrovicoccus sp. HB161399]|uniref:class I SAM-dependent methyltransferase n=1 Tax=Mangrovicoccus sp. HB161399 TaxID=2720392 RepID=UPI001551E5CA|nr:class I SAM-dependent methyltransferase [Mangrovicoccus sp. HB161399]
MQADHDHGDLMDRVYRHQAAIYDLTRKYYLLGRDRLIDELDVEGDGTVLEIACGTGRNLIRIGNRYRDAQLFGVDISHKMLRQASKNSARSAMRWRIKLAKADACSFDPGMTLGQAQFDRIVFSYCLSMIPDWQGALAHAVPMLAPGGRIHMVDFGLQSGLPRWFGKGMHLWLSKFHVAPRAGMAEAFERLAAEHGLETDVRPLYRDYAVIGTLARPAA